MGSSNTVYIAGWIFQLRVRELLRRGGPIQLFPIHGHRAAMNFVYNDDTASEEERDQGDLQLLGSGEHILVERDRLCDGQYLGHPDVDVGDHPAILLTFCATWNKEHDVSGEDLRRINGLNFPPPTNTYKYLVVATPDEVRPEIKVPRSFFEGEGQRERKGEAPEDLLPIFHYPVSMEELFPLNTPGSRLLSFEDSRDGVD